MYNTTGHADTLISHHHPPANVSEHEHNYRLLRIYAYYRTLLSSILLLLFTGGLADDTLGANRSMLFVYIASVYTITNLITLLLLWKRRFEPDNRQIFALLVVDLCALALMLHSSVGMDIGYLLLVVVAAGSIFLPMNLSLGIAGFGTLLVLGENIYSHQMQLRGKPEIFSAGVFGILLFGTAYAFSLLSERIRRSNIEALVQGAQAAYLE